MKNRLSKSNVYILFILIAIFHWGITFFLENRFYLAKSPYHQIIKLLVLIIFWQIIYYIFKRYKREIEYRIYLRYSMYYFLLSFLFLLLIWPGNWIWDDLRILYTVHINEMYVWHHFITRFFFISALFIFPDPVSILILQLACISMIVGYFVYAVSTMLACRSKLVTLLYLPFLLPPVLIMNNTAMRSTLFSYLILFFTIHILFTRWKNKPIATTHVFFLCLISCIFISLRGEALVYLVMGPLLFIVAFWNLTQFKQKFFYIASTVCLVFVILNIQTSLLGEKSVARYQFSLYLDPFIHLVETARKNNQTDLVSEVDQILYTEDFIDITSKETFPVGIIIRDSFFDKDNQKKLTSFFFELLKKYPKDFLSQRWARFYASYPLQIASNQIGDDSMPLQEQSYCEELFKKSFFSYYLDRQLRKKVLDSLATKESRSFLHNITNLLIPFFTLFGIAITALFRKQWTPMLAVTSIMSMYVPIFLGAPDSLFMYYFSFYLCAYAFIGIMVFYYFKPKP